MMTAAWLRTSHDSLNSNTTSMFSIESFLLSSPSNSGAVLVRPLLSHKVQANFSLS